MSEREIGELLAAIAADLASVAWSREYPPGSEDADLSARFYRGISPMGRYTVCAFSIENQGFPAGSMGHDGAFAGGGVICRLTRELAERAFKLAEAP